MPILSAVEEFSRRIPTVATTDGLQNILWEACQRFDIRYFALSHHVDFLSQPQAIRIHNYPEGWEHWYDVRGLGLSDPIHRASHRTAAGFLWRDVDRIIPMSRSDRRLMKMGREIGLGEGVTIPAHVPGDARGSCTFVAADGKELPPGALFWAQSIGLIAFERVRNMERLQRGIMRPALSDRQRECIALAARGCSDRRIAEILGIGLHSVIAHMKQAREKLGVCTRGQLIWNSLDGGELCFADVRGLLL